MVSAYRSTMGGGLLAAAAASVLDGGDWPSMIRDFGILAVLVFFFTWASWKREERISNQVSTLELFVQKELMVIVTTSTTALQDNTHALVNMREALFSKPCLVPEDVAVMKSTKDLMDQLEQLTSRVEAVNNRQVSQAT